MPEKQRYGKKVDKARQLTVIPGTWFLCRAAASLFSRDYPSVIGGNGGAGQVSGKPPCGEERRSELHPLHLTKKEGYPCRMRFSVRGTS